MIRRMWSRLIEWGQYVREDRGIIFPVVNDDIRLPTPIRFRIQRATGGNIVEVCHYDRKTDQEHVNLHIIPDDNGNMPEAIARIVTVELLKA